jgi:hypothetical protein
MAEDGEPWGGIAKSIDIWGSFLISGAVMFSLCMVYALVCRIYQYTFLYEACVTMNYLKPTQHDRTAHCLPQTLFKYANRANL